MSDTQASTSAGHGNVEVLETHISTVVLMGERALKFPKPLRNAFIDQSTVDKRRVACEQELRLNRRIAPDVYLGIGDIVENDEVTDHFLVMRRLPLDRRLSALVRTPAFPDHVRRVARALATFHAREPANELAAELSTADAMAALWSGNLAELRQLDDGTLDGSMLERVARQAARYVGGREALFEARIARGYARDGHGDLLADDVFMLDDGPRILDCLAFDERLRCGDVLLDLAFLAMDLERLGSPDMAARLIDWYCEFTDEHHPRSLVDLYVAYRALVRTKVNLIRSQQGDRSAAAAAQQFLRQCVAHLDAAVPMLVLVGGAPGTGKTTLARGVGDRQSVMVVSSDVVRKELAAIETGAHAYAGPGEGIYTPDMTRRTYVALLHTARTALAAGESVVLDASWTRADDRADARALAEEVGAIMVEIRCELDPQEAATRIRARMRTDDPSDATPDIATHLRSLSEPWPEAAAISTTADVEDAVEAASTTCERARRSD